MRGFDVVTEKDEGDEKVVDVRLVHRQEDQWSIVLKHKEVNVQSDTNRNI